MDIREETKDKVLSIKNNNILLEYPTSFGKSRIAIELIKNRHKKDNNILIVIPKLALISNWKDEFIKWKAKDIIKDVTFVTYMSFPKKEGAWEIVVFDEAHHLSERCRDALYNFNIQNSILLSATVGRDLRAELSMIFPKLYIHHIKIKEAIEKEVLPSPKVILLPLKLDNTKKEYLIIKNRNKKDTIKVPYEKVWTVKGIKDKRIEISCTQQQYYTDMCGLIEFYKRKMHIPLFKNMYLHSCGERLRWLSDQKTTIVYEILKRINNYRTLTFCNSILQTEVLGKYCINSKNRESLRYLDAFNAGKINHITACGILDEGVNLKNCKIGVYAALNNSERMIKQRLGRLLRHKEPILIIPYYKFTRDEELVSKMCTDYDPEAITIINNLNELKI